MTTIDIKNKKQAEEILREDEEIVLICNNQKLHILSSSNGFDYSIYPASSSFDENDEFNEDEMIDGGVFEGTVEKDLINFIYEEFMKEDKLLIKYAQDFLNTNISIHYKF